MTQPDLPGDGRIVVLAGPGVLEPPEGRGVRGLRSFAAAGDLGVANTWGAKGVFDWDSPHHLGTCGLQARDFELLGWAGADVIVATGVDDAESPRECFALAPVLDVDPDDLDARAGTVRSTGPPLINDLYARLAAIAQPGFVDDRVPLHPARAVADLAAALPTGGLLAADPGPAGLWVARTFPTPAVTPGGPRRVVVPAVTVPGTAARAASDAARAQRPAIIVTTDPVDPATAAVFDDLSAAGAAVVLVVWGERGRLEHVGQHRERLDTALTATGAAVVEIPVDFSCTELLVDAAGSVIAWPGLADDRLR